MPDIAQPNGPRPEKTTGRNRNSVANIASKTKPRPLVTRAPQQPAVPALKPPGVVSVSRPTNREAPKTPADKAAAKTPSESTPALELNPALNALTNTTSMKLALLAAQAAQPQAPADYSGVGHGGDPHDNIQLAKRMASRMGWTDAQWRSLRKLGNLESGWRKDAANPTSSARGIPQAMMSVHFGDDWRNNPAAQRFLRNAKVQISWMLSYIKDRYGDPVAALRFHLANGYY